MALPPPILDHLILVVPSLSSSDLSFYSDAGFTVIQGGTHADGLTQNALICLPNGIYLELLAFVPGTSPEARQKHWWGQKLPGWADWSISPHPVTCTERYEALSLASSYDAPAAGGRKTLDGKDLKWVIGFPKVDRTKGEYRGRMPFWCEDVTPREWRVPEPKEAHENGAKGVTSITLLSDSLEQYKKDLAKVVPVAKEEEKHQFELGVLKSTSESEVVKVFVREPKDQDEKEWVKERGEGLYSVTMDLGKGRLVGVKQGGRLVLP